ncbi:translocation/assembly module TamB domain-containing protein [Parvularcula lutaonensis]|uniref:Translocation/assembly module TamB domain-containing protein n=1 Tax=Parvularcula lutaonensis TaxID=491923 RepID=A0ABV7M762_9PROT|nr:translocation/assembly module TamB domain-containing protein [Parvularcula lutaonensis]GGY41025.1 hypothetical protein GCM10007148_07000 [Parvularcula lutaonensis]
MLRRVLTYIGIGLLVLIGLVLLSLIPLTQTALGISLADRFSRPIIEDLVADRLGSEVSYAPLAGRLPNQIVIRDLELRKDGEVWARAERFALRWDAMKLLSGEIHIREIVLADAALLDEPTIEPSEKPDEDPDDEPLSLPDIRVDALVIDDFLIGERIFGQPYGFSLQGEGRYQDPGLRFSLFAETDEGTDSLRMSGLFDGKAIDGDISVLSRDNGIISTLAKAEGPIALEAVATGPLENLRAEIKADAAIYGKLEGTLGGSMDEMDALSATLTYAPGSLLPEDARKALGDAVRLTATGIYREERATLTIDTFEGAFGAINGEISADLGEVRAANAVLRGEIDPDVLAPYDAEELGGAMELDAGIEESGDGFLFSGAVTAGQARLAVREGQSSNEVPFSGKVNIRAKGLTIQDPRIDPMLREGATVEAIVRYNADGLIRARNINAVIGTTQGRRLMLTGDARYGLESTALDADVTLRAGPQALALLAGTGSYQSPLTLTATANGTAQQFKLDANAALPAGAIDGNAFGAGNLTAQIRGLPSAPSGTIRLTSAGDDYNGEVAFDVRGKDLNVTRIDLNAGAIRAEGRARINLDTQAATVDLTIDAGRRSTLVTGQVVGGQIDLDANIGKGLNPVAVTLSGRDLRFEENEIGDLTLDANGPRSAVRFNLATTDISAGSVLLQSVQSEGSIDLRDDQALYLERLRMTLLGDDDQVVELSTPTVISWREGISIAPTTVDYFGGGELNLSADIGKSRWQASIDAKAMPVPRANAIADFNLDLDTSAPTPATFALKAQANTDDDEYSLVADGAWSGSLVTLDAAILRGTSEQLGTIDAQLPVRLVRSPSIGVEVGDRDLDIRIAYSDRIAPLWAFVPIDGQPVTGEIAADIRITGSPSEPLTEGTIKLKGGRFEESTIGITLTNLNGTASFNVAPGGTRGEVNITGSGASGRNESVRLSGTVSTRGTESSLDLNLDLDNAQIADSPELEARVTASLDLEGSFTEMTLSGPIILDELDIHIPEIESSDSVPTFAPVNVVRIDGTEEDRARKVETPDETPVTVNLDISVEARNGVFIRGRGLESEWAADLEIRGTADAPIIGGDVNLLDGSLDLAGREFDITKGAIAFQRTKKIDPIIEMEAETEAGDPPDTVTAIVNVSGPASDPTISFRSNPSLPEEDVLALILFGRRASELGAGEALQLAQAAAQLSGAFGVGPGIGGTLRSGLGLDRLSIDPTGRSLTVGKYVSDDVYISARQGFGTVGTVISVVYEVSRFFNLEATLQPDGAQTIGANYKRDY